MKNITSNQLALIGLAAVLLLVAAFSFYLLQDPSAPLPFSPPAATSTITPLPSAETIVPILSDSSIPTRQTSYTPFATRTTPTLSTLSQTVSPSTQPTTPGLTATLPSGKVTPSLSPTRSPTVRSTSATTPAPTTPAASPSPTITQTLSAGEIGVTGRILLNGTAVAGVKVEFKDDVAPRTTTTDAGGHYLFTTLAPGYAFSLTFRQSDNPQLTPPAEITSLAHLEGNLPNGVTTINLPDFEISLDQNGSIFELQDPANGATYSASVISSANPIQFAWSQYNTTGTYQIAFGPHGSDQPSWTSTMLAATSFMWNGDLNNSSHVTEGTYWWRVSINHSLGIYVVVVYTQPFEIFFDP